MSNKTVNRRDFVGFIAAGTAAMTLSSVECANRHNNHRPPNFIIINADDCSAKEFGCYGNKEYKTPNIDKLARTGVMFKTFWCTPICSPT